MARRGAYAKGIAKREEILQVALDVIARHGYRGASVREIADAVGLSQAGLLHYFDSKDELFTAVLRKRDELAQGGEDDDPADMLEGFVRIIARNREVPGLVHLYTQLSVEAADPSHAAHDYFVERFENLRRFTTDALRRGQADGSLRSDFDADRMASVVIAAADGLQTQWLLDPSIDMGREIAALVDALRAG
ncbi:TetR/AcrR family transcriptional regulator [Microbacterium sp. G2-8]|uniref:TetR/AcrR family transcriptional regulator n=1 Tax=Microbacterium sp. G2-8 TaxID=2842454 RepID=UPI001C8A473D|nr:TetR/AcrR family transcriptional regulator [Microbacterium sp. G2-8]